MMEAKTESCMSTLTKKYMVEKLTENNYRMWKLRMNLILERSELLDVVSGKEKIPAKEPELIEWKKKDLEARIEIIMHLSDEQVDLVKDLKSSKEIWDTLKERHEPSDRTTKINTLRNLVTMEMNEDDSIETLIRNWQSALDSALSAGNKIDEDMRYDMILGSLPDSWDNFVTTHGSDDTSDIKTLFAKMRREELRRKKPRSKNDGSIAMAATMRGQQGNQPNLRNLKFKPQQMGATSAITISTISCRYCHKLGHIERDCRNKKYDQRNKERRFYPQANTASIPNEEDTFATDDEDSSFIQAFTCHLRTKEIYEEEEIESFMAGLQTTAENLWFFDTGATHHLTNSREWLHNYTTLSKQLEVRFGDNGTKMAIGKGTINLSINSKNIISISNVYFVPGLAKNLLSVNEATSNGAILEFHNNYAIIRHKSPTGEEIKTICPKMGRLYPLRTIDNKPIEANIASSYHEIAATLLWHHRLGHLHPKSMQHSQINQLMEGIPSKPFTYLSICEGCIHGKQCRQKFPIHTHRNLRPLQLVHSDLCGPMQTSSITGNRYFITFTDDFTRFTILYFLKSKAGAFNAFKTYKTLVENQCQSKITTIRTDNGGEYCSKEWISLCNTHGIRHEHSIPYNPQQNGVAERKNRTLLDASRSMLQVAGLHNEFWQEAVATACYLQNRSPHKVLGSNTPYSLWFGRKPHVGHLRIFGATAYNYVPSTIRRKLDSHSVKCVFVGYGECNGIKGYKLYVPQKKQFFYNRSVTFDEQGLFQQKDHDGDTYQQSSGKTGEANQHIHDSSTIFTLPSQGEEGRKQPGAIGDPAHKQQSEQQANQSILTWQQDMRGGWPDSNKEPAAIIGDQINKCKHQSALCQARQHRPAYDEEPNHQPAIITDGQCTQTSVTKPVQVWRRRRNPLCSDPSTSHPPRKLRPVREEEPIHLPATEIDGSHPATEIDDPYEQEPAQERRRHSSSLCSNLSTPSISTSPSLALCQQSTDETLHKGAIHTIPCPNPTKKRHRSLSEIYAVTEPLEALFVDLNAGDDTHSIDDYEEEGMHPSVEEALRSTNASEWREAMCTEIDALKKNNTWTLIPPPQGKVIDLYSIHDRMLLQLSP